MALSYDLLVYHDMHDSLHDAPPEVGEDAAAWFGDTFAGLYVVAVGPGIHEGCATVVLAHEYRPERMQQMKAYVARRGAAVAGNGDDSETTLA